MYGKTIRAILIFMTGFSLVSLAGLAFSAYSFYKGAQVGISDLYALMKKRAESTADILSRIAGEDYPESHVLLSESMRSLAEESKQSGDPLQIEEAFLIDLTGKIIAHNDVAYVAESSERGYRSGSEYTVDRNTTRRDSVSIRVMEEFPQPSDYMNMPAYYFLQRTEPALLAQSYHVSAAVFPVDGIIATGVLHLHFRNRFTESFLYRFTLEFRNSVFHTFAFSLGAALLITILYAAIGSAGSTDEMPAEERAEKALQNGAGSGEVSYRDEDLEEAAAEPVRVNENSVAAEDLPDYSLSHHDEDDIIDLSEKEPPVSRPSLQTLPETQPGKKAALRTAANSERIADAIPLRVVK